MIVKLSHCFTFFWAQLTSSGCSQGFPHFAGFPTSLANDGKCDDDGDGDVSYLDAAHQHQRGGDGEELPVDEAGDEEEKTHGHSAGNPTTPSVGENKWSLNSLKKNCQRFSTFSWRNWASAPLLSPTWWIGSLTILELYSMYAYSGL